MHERRLHLLVGDATAILAVSTLCESSAAGSTVPRTMA